MNWTDEGLLLSVNPHGEKSAIIQVLTRTKGLHAGIIQNAFSRKMSYTLQPSSQLHLNWSSRLEEHLGTYKVDLLKTRVDILLKNKLAFLLFSIPNKTIAFIFLVFKNSFSFSAPSILCDPSRIIFLFL